MCYQFELEFVICNIRWLKINDNAFQTLKEYVRVFRYTALWLCNTRDLIIYIIVIKHPIPCTHGWDVEFCGSNKWKTYFACILTYHWGNTLICHLKKQVTRYFSGVCFARVITVLYGIMGYIRPCHSGTQAYYVAGLHVMEDDGSALSYIALPHSTSHCIKQAILLTIPSWAPSWQRGAH